LWSLPASSVQPGSAGNLPAMSDGESVPGRAMRD